MYEIDWQGVKEEAVEVLRRYIQIDTTNPPGNEEEAALFLRSLLEKEGIKTQIYTSAPRRGNLLASLEGGSDPPFLLLSHMDVVPVERERWSVDPLAGEVKEGYIYGRGAIDMKGQGVAELMAFLLVHRHRIPLRRPLLLLAAADEEAGGRWGVDWMLENEPQLKRVGFVLNEGGTIRVRDDGRVHHYEISTAQKVVAQFRLRSKGRTGHGSMPHRENANDRLVRALKKLIDWEAPVEVIPLVKEYFRNLAPLNPSESAHYEDIEKGLRDDRFREHFTSNPQYNAMVRNTHTLTMLRSGTKVNVIPSEAEATFDCRLLPGTKREEFFRRLKEVMGDEEIEFIPLEDFEGKDPLPSPTDGELYRAILRVAQRKDPGVIVTPFLITGATDSRFFRELGIPCYDFTPFRLTQEELRLIHGHDERISSENLLFAIQFLFEVILEVAT